MPKQVLKQLRALQLGDLVFVEWLDASIGRGRTTYTIDVPVESFGVYLGCLGSKQKHIILSQNSFCFAETLYDVDYTAIPLVWSTRITVIKSCQIEEKKATTLLNCFLAGRRRTMKRRTNNHYA